MTTPQRAVLTRRAVRGPLLLCAALAAALPADAAQAKEAPAAWDGLERRQSKDLDYLYVRPGVAFTAYRRVRLDPVEVEFDKGWDPNRGTRQLSQRLSKEDIQQIRTRLAGSFAKVLSDTLAKGGYALVEADDEDVLRVTASLVNVYVNAPAKAAAETSATYVKEAGTVTLLMELRDSVTGQVLARVVDTAHAQAPGRAQVSTTGSNAVAAEEVFREWAGRLKKGLDVVNGKAAEK